MKKEYISLKEATRYCHYSSDYLKLRARQGKLKAIKMGRNWFTTREWLEDYKNKLQPLRTTGSKSKTTGKWLIFFKEGLFLFLVVFLIVAVGFLLLSFFQPTLEKVMPALEKIIPAKVIEIKQ